MSFVQEIDPFSNLIFKLSRLISSLKLRKDPMTIKGMLSLAKLVELLFASPVVFTSEMNASFSVDVPPQETIPMKRTIEKIVTSFFIFFGQWFTSLITLYLF